MRGRGAWRLPAYGYRNPPDGSSDWTGRHRPKPARGKGEIQRAVRRLNQSRPNAVI